MRILLALLLILSSCAHQQPKHTYLKYSGYIDGCASGTVDLVLALDPDIKEEEINQVWLDSRCMNLYLERLEQENIKPKMIRVNKVETI